MLGENVDFFMAYFLGKNSQFGIETSHTVKVNHWFHEKREIFFKSLIHETKFANSMIFRSKNGGLKAWSHSARKANSPVIG